MIIRNAQFKVFEESAVNNYILELAEHCRDYSPRLCKTLNDEQLHDAIRYGMARAEEHGFTKRGPVRFYIDMMIVLGSSFDTDPQYPWTSEILSKKDELTEMERAEALHEKIVIYLQEVDGEDNEYTLKALESLRNLYQKGIAFRHESLDRDLLHLMKEIHPRKVTETGEEILRNLIADGKKRGESLYGFREAQSLALTAVLMFAFGHRFDADPLLPWISRTLNQTDQTAPDTAAKDLERRAIIWLDAVLRNAKEGK